jgi:hypothetical protein
MKLDGHSQWQPSRKGARLAGAPTSKLQASLLEHDGRYLGAVAFFYAELLNAKAMQ